MYSYGDTILIGKDIEHFRDKIVPAIIEQFVQIYGYGDSLQLMSFLELQVDKYRDKFISENFANILKTGNLGDAPQSFISEYCSRCRRLLKIKEQSYDDIHDYLRDKYIFQALCSFDLYLQEYTSKKTFLLDELLNDAFSKYPVFSPDNQDFVLFENVKGFVDIEENYVIAPTDVPLNVSELSFKRDKAYNDYKMGLITNEQYAAVCSEYDRATSYSLMPPILYEAKYDNGTEYGQRIDVTEYLLDRLRVKEYKEGDSSSTNSYYSEASGNAFSDYLEEFAAKYRR